MIAALLATSSLVYIMTPRMPLYQVTSLKVTRFRFSIYNSCSISATIQAGVRIENENFFGADLHSTIVDLYYPDLKGHLKHIGYLSETIEEAKKDDNNDYDNCMNGSQKNSKISSHGDVIEDDHGICLPDETMSSSSSLSEPFFTIQPRGTSISKSDAVTIVVKDMYPSVYLNLIKDAILSLGKMEIFISGVAHVKSPLGIPLSLGILCDNTVEMHIPIKIVGKSCTVRSVSTGWSALTELAAEVREKAMDVIATRINADIATAATTSTNNSGVEKGKRVNNDVDDINSFLQSSEVILDWHDF